MAAGLSQGPQHLRGVQRAAVKTEGSQARSPARWCALSGSLQSIHELTGFRTLLTGTFVTRTFVTGLLLHGLLLRRTFVTGTFLT